MRWASGPVMVWELAGRPVRDSIRPEPVPGVCAMCGRHVDTSLATAKAIGGNFTDQYQLARPDSPRICYACVWVCSGKPPDTVRMWTVACAPGAGFPASHPKSPGWGNADLLLTARNDMRQVVAMLADPPDGPWLVSVAESGQKHPLPYARINHGTALWTVRMDAVDVTATPGMWRHVFGHVVALRTAGYTAAEIEQLAPPVHKLTAEGMPVWRHHAGHLTPHRGSALIHLATFLINKEHLDEYHRLYGAPGPADADRVGVPVHQRPAGHARGDTGTGQGSVDQGADGAGDGLLDGVLF